MTTPDIIGTVRGYRFWRMLRDDQLSSIAQDFAWQPGINVAEHLPRSSTYQPWQPNSHHPPGLCDSCGFYSMYQPIRAQFSATGVIENEGEITLHETGLRSERARIVAIHHRKHSTREQLQRRYPEARVYASRRKMLHDFPQVDDICGVPTEWDELTARAAAETPQMARVALLAISTTVIAVALVIFISLLFSQLDAAM